MRRKFVGLLLPALFALFLAGCGHVSINVPWDRPSPPAGMTLQEINAVDDLRQVFNRDSGHPRLLVLVSPT